MNKDNIIQTVVRKIDHLVLKVADKQPIPKVTARLADWCFRFYTISHEYNRVIIRSLWLGQDG